MKRSERSQTAQETVAILQQGSYRTTTGQTVHIAADLAKSVAATRVIRPADWRGIIAKATAVPERAETGSVEVTGETTLAAAHRMIVSDARTRVLALNFASAKNAGGGFLGGSQAQEECLARSSGLYASLQVGGDYYEVNRQCKSMLYTDHAIFSPNVPVLRDDDGCLLERPYLVSFLTMPAVNVGAIKPGSGDIGRVEGVMAGRVEDVIALAASEGYTDVILGAWGCGVFRNDPRMISRLFRDCLHGPGRWAWRLERIVFAVFDTSANHAVLSAFTEAFDTLVRREEPKP